MKKNNLKRFLASLLAVLMLASATGMSPAVFAEGEDNLPQTEGGEVVQPELKNSATPIEVRITSDMKDEDVLAVLAEKLIENKNEIDPQSLEWTYTCAVNGTYKLLINVPTLYKRPDTVSVIGGETKVVPKDKDYTPKPYYDTTYVYPALKNNDNGVYTLQLNGQDVQIKKVDKYTSTIVFKENATITYNMDAAAQKEAIIKNAIDYEQSTLPAGTGVDDFTVELKSLISWKDIPNAKLDAGENQTIRISYNGNADFKPCKNAEGFINVEKANVKVSMKRFTTVYAGQNIDKDVLKVALDPNDPAIDVYIVFAGINTKLNTSVNLVLTKQQWAVIENISKFQQFIFDLDTKNVIFKDKTTLQQKLEKGMTIGEFKAYMLGFIDDLEKATNIPVIGGAIKDAIEKYGISIDSLKTMATIFDKLTAFSDDTQIALGAPKHAGLYTAFALAVNKNYNTGVANGIVRIAMNTAGMKLVPNADIKGKSIDAETAKQMRETGTPALVTLYCGDSAENVDQSSIHYWFTGVNTIYAGSKMPTKPGKYIVTASVYGGDYLAPPVTFTFRITK